MNGNLFSVTKVCYFSITAKFFLNNLAYMWLFCKIKGAGTD